MRVISEHTVRATHTPAREGEPTAPPSNPPARKRADRTVWGHVRLTPAELTAWRGKADAAGVTLSELARSAMERTRTWMVPARAVAQARTRELARIRANLNQLARWANAHQSVADAGEVLAHLVAIDRLLAELRIDTRPRGPVPPPESPPAASAARGAVVPIRATPAELAAWRTKAAAAGVTLSELARSAMERTRTWPAPAREIQQARTREVARLGANVNQIARWVNIHQAAADAGEVIAHLVAIDRLLDALRDEPEAAAQ